jgi:hypothetical protein
MRVLRRAMDRREPLDEGVRHYLETGEHLPGAGHGWLEPFMVSGRILHAATTAGPPVGEWVEWGVEITAQWIAAHPGTRPFAWGVYEASGPRHVLTGAERLPDREPNPIQWRLARGVPYGAHELREGDAPVMIESEAAYLKRHDLLSDVERRALKPRAFARDAIDEGPEEDTDDDDAR